MPIPLPKYPKARERIAHFCGSLPENMQGPCITMKTGQFERAVRFADGCNLEDLVQTFRELGDENRAYCDVLEGLVKQKALTSDEYDKVLDKLGDYDEAVVEAVKESLVESCQCKLR